MSLKSSQYYLLQVLTLLLLTGCLAEPLRSPPRQANTSAADRPVVLTTFSILADIARNVAGDRLEVRSITREGAEIHGYEPSPSDIKRATGANLIVKNGLGLEAWFQRFIRSVGDVPTVTLSDSIDTPLPIIGDRPNPHIWMSPQLTVKYVDVLVSAFTKLDPSSTELFIANGAAYKARLLELDKEMREGLAVVPKEQRLLVTCERAFSYLAIDYGLDEAYLWPMNGESQVTPQRMARLIEVVQRRKVPAVFCESTVSDKAQRQVAHAAGTKFGGNLYVDSLSTPDGPTPTLLDLQRYNVRLIIKGLAPQGEINAR
ncbi:metal ABC transporter substrate-binding protein [cyanobiont of Ornithocercus magnificus]|nr:metal ABC transporter substrate-binding protein [cyanobiont of Ornithocercus magnificus]